MHRLHLGTNHKDKETADKKETPEASKHHSLLHHHHHAEKPAVPTEVPTQAVADTIPIEATPRKHKSQRLSQHVTGLFSSKVAPHATEQPPMPLKRVPSVKLSEEMLKNLWTEWDRGNQEKRPATWLVMVSQLAIKSMVSQHVEFTKDKLGLMATLDQAYKALSEQVNQDEAKRAEYAVDPDLDQAKIAYETASSAYKKDYDVKMLAHKIEVERLRAVIEDIDQKKIDVTAETVIQKLKDLTVYQSLHQEIMENIRRTEQMVDRQSCCKKAFFCKPDPEMTRLSHQLTGLQQQRMALAAGDIEFVRKTLMDKLEAQREETRKNLDEVTKQMPVFNDDAHQKAVEAQATILNAEQTYYKQLSLRAMQCFLRVIVLIETLSVAIPRPNPLLSSVNAPTLSAVIEPAADARLCALVDELRDRLHGQLLDYYCMEPGKYLFDVYHQRVDQLPPEQQLAFLSGKTDAGMLQTIFPSLPQNDGLTRQPSMRI